MTDPVRHDPPLQSQAGWRDEQRSALARVQSVGELVSLLRVHQRQRWQQGQLVRVEDYLADFPLLASDGQAVVDLVFHEIQLREENGPPPQLEEFLQRLPEHAASIEIRYGLHHLLASPPAPNDTGHGQPATVDEAPAPGPPAAAKFPRLLRYEVLRELGRGGMGVVYLARQQGLDRLVALKMILAGVHAGPAELARFRAEALAISRLQHPNLVQVYEVGEHEGQPFFSMEYVSGGTLASHIDGKPQPPEKAAELTHTLALGVHCAHQHGIVHRDLKPANVLMDASAIPKITDFGLAKRNDGGASDQTRTGAVLGTPSYMAPEQAGGRSKDVGPAADIYALGAILYELLTGRPPFVADTAWDTIRLVISQEPLPPSQLQRRLPVDLETICLKCLDKEPAKRYASALELADDLQRFRENRPILARPAGMAERLRKWVKRRPAAAALLAVSVLALVGFLAGVVYHHVNLHEALEQARQARRLSDERLIHLYIYNGNRAADRGHLLNALPWLIEAMRDDQDERNQDAHRLRLTTVLHECPRLERMLFQDDRVLQAEFSPDESLIVTSCGDGTVQVWNAQSGAALGPPFQHGNNVARIAISPDGQWIVSAGDDQAWVWEARTGKKRFAMPLKHQGPVYWVAFSHDGQRVATSGDDGLARSWDAASGKLLREFRHGQAIRCVAFNPADDRLLTASDDGTGQLWNADTGERATPPLQHEARVNYAAFSHDGQRVVTAAADGKARLWSAETGQATTPPLLHDGAVLTAAFSPNDRLVVTAGVDGTARVWDAVTGNLLTLVRHESMVLTVEFSRDGLWFVTASDDNTACVWDAAHGRRLGPPMWHNGSLQSARFSADGRRVLTASGSGITRVWHVGRRIPGPTLVQGGPVKTASFSPDGRLVLTGSEDGSAQLWDATGGRPVGSNLIHEAPVQVALFSADGRQVVTASGRTVRVWDSATQQPLTPPLQHPGEVRAAAVSQDGRYVAGGSADGTVQVWEARTGQKAGPPLMHSQAVLGVAFSPDGRQLLTACADDVARVWDLAGTPAIRHELRHDGDIFDVSYSLDGRWIVTASNDRTARVWDAATGQAATPPLAHSSYVSRATFSPDCRLVVTGSDDNSARIWDARTGQPLTPPLWHLGGVLQARFSADGRFVITASADRSARVWWVANGSAVTVSLWHDLPVADANFSPDGLRLVTASLDRTARVWDLTRDPRPIEDLMLEAEILAGGWIDATGGFVPLQEGVLCKLWHQYHGKQASPR